ncbi:MAG: hypothetical protein KDE14_09360, partial [Rhodobacteraceae bacterium]|nr:hypothetical protein [Paracoccaceae bacterium]
MRELYSPCTRATLLALLSTTAITSLAPVTAAVAQQGAMLEEIVVTAQRREQSLLDVPIAVTSFGAAELERNGVPDIIFLNQTVPNVTVERSRATNSTLTAFIRGVGQQDP